jgi:hypothetical protein
MNSQIQYKLLKGLWMPFFILVCMFLFVLQSEAQEKPPRPITVTVSTAQHLRFGSFIQSGVNGTVTVTYDGFRTATGSIILPNMSSIVTPALFIVDAEPGTLITILNGPTATLTGSNGGTISLELGASSTRSPFITRSQYTDVFIGGTLTVGSLQANPAGFYNGTFQVTFIQE